MSDLQNDMNRAVDSFVAQIPERARRTAMDTLESAFGGRVGLAGGARAHASATAGPRVGRPRGGGSAKRTAEVSDRQTAPGRGDFPGGGRDTLRGLSDRPHARLITAAPGCRVDVGDIRPSRPSARELSECRAECRRSVATRLPAMRQQVRKIT